MGLPEFLIWIGLAGRPTVVAVITYTLLFAVILYGGILLCAYLHPGVHAHRPAALNAVKWSFLAKFLSVALSVIALFDPSIYANALFCAATDNVDSVGSLIGQDKAFWGGLSAFLGALCLRLGRLKNVTGS